jgi:hypothetical protein
VAGALKRLRSCGFLTWVRRLEYTGEPGHRGREVRQATNAYAIGTPADALDLVGKVVVPADAITRIRERAAFLAECAGQAFENSKLGRAFAAWESKLLDKPSLPSARNPSSGIIC